MHTPPHPPAGGLAPVALPPDTPAPAGPTPATDVGRARLRSRVAARLAPVCASMAPEHFARLVEDVTAFTLRWSRDTAVNDYGVQDRAD